MSWLHFSEIAFIAGALWLLGVLFSYLPKIAKHTLWATLLTTLGLVVFGGYIAFLWLNMGRPPMRTLGETRLWYSFFLVLVSLFVYLRWRFTWFLAYGVFMGGIFLLINVLKPETHSETLMPALQSPWFVPHVIVYMFSYALLAAASLVAVKGLYLHWNNRWQPEIITLADNLVYIGFAFLTLGLLFGALWAKEAWGHYWTWDPKETWAFLTWLGYMLYLHMRYHKPNKQKQHLWVLALAFVVLLICWLGINYLPSAQNSVHVYS
ncbi:MAG: cytochrome c biogenesis protein CcsA [Bacteroidales bacterium]